MKNVAVPRSPSALTAIAAVLALSAIPASAQEVQAPSAAPSLSLPQDITATPPATTAPVATPTVTTPTVTLPPEATAPLNVPTGTATTAGTTPPSSVSPTQQQTVMLPDVAPPATPADAAAEPSSRPAQPRRAASAPRAERAAAEPARPSVPTAQDNGTAGDGTLAQGSVPPAAPAPARADAAPAAPPPAQPAPATDNGDGFPVTEVAGILAALGVAGFGIAAMRRRRREPVYEEAEYAPEPFEPASTAEPVPAPVPVQREHVIAGNSATAVLAASPLPQTAEERYELLDAMAAAQPDEGNPFTSRKGRLRRARLQLQHREHLEASGQAAGFDFRTYRPSTRPTEAAPSASTRELTEV